MKKIIALGFLFLSVFLAGCGNKQIAQTQSQSGNIEKAPYACLSNNDCEVRGVDEWETCNNKKEPIDPRQPTPGRRDATSPTQNGYVCQCVAQKCGWMAKTQPPIISQPSGNFNCEDLYKEIEKDMENANYCQSNADCDVLMLGGSYIKFGCYHFINKEVNKQSFYDKMKKYTSQCSLMINKCARAPEAKCVSIKGQRKCVSAGE